MKASLAESVPASPLAPVEPQASQVAIALGTIYVLWSTTFMAIREALDGLPPFTLGVLRYALAGVIMLAYARVTNAVRPSRREVLGAGGLGILLVFMPNAPVLWAEQSITTGVTALLGACTPLFVLALEIARPLGDRPTRWGLIGILTGLAGVLVLVAPQLSHGLGAALTAEVAMLVGSFVAAGTMVHGKRLPSPTSAAYSSGLSMLFGALLFAGVALGRDEAARVHLALVPTHAWLGLAYLVIFGSCLGFSAFTWLVRHARPTLVATMSYVNPVMAVIVGVLVLGEPLQMQTVIAAALILLSVVLVATAGRRR